MTRFAMITDLGVDGKVETGDESARREIWLSTFHHYMKLRNNYFSIFKL